MKRGLRAKAQLMKRGLQALKLIWSELPMSWHRHLRTIPKTIIIQEIPAPHMFKDGRTDRDILHEHAIRIGMETVRVGWAHHHQHTSPQGMLLPIDFVDSRTFRNQKDLRKIMPVKRKRARPAKKPAGGTASTFTSDVTPSYGFHNINKTETIVIGQVESKRENLQDENPL